MAEPTQTDKIDYLLKIYYKEKDYSWTAIYLKRIFIQHRNLKIQFTNYFGSETLIPFHTFHITFGFSFLFLL